MNDNANLAIKEAMEEDNKLKITIPVYADDLVLENAFKETHK